MTDNIDMALMPVYKYSNIILLLSEYFATSLVRLGNIPKFAKLKKTNTLVINTYTPKRSTPNADMARGKEIS